MQLDNAFCENAYIDGRSLNHAFFGAILDTLKLTQHLYKREDLAKLYHYLGDLFENGNFDWAGETSFAPAEIKSLTKTAKTAKMSGNKS